MAALVQLCRSHPHPPRQLEFSLPQCDARKEHGEKSIGLHARSQAIDHANQAKSDEIVEDLAATLQAAPSPSDTGGDTARQHTSNDGGQRGPNHIDQEPSCPRGAQFVQAEQPEAKHHEWKSGSVIHAGFAGQREAQIIIVAGMAGLHIRRKDRVRRRQHRPQQDRRSPGESEDKHGEPGDHGHAEGHPQPGEPDGCRPASDFYGDRHLDTCREQRNQDGDFSQHFEQCGLPKRIDIKEIHAGRPQQHPDDQVHNRGCHGQAPEDFWRKAAAQQQETDEQEPVSMGHR